MSVAQRWSEIEALTRGALARWSKVEGSVQQASPPLSAGDLILLPATASRSVEWAVIAEEPGEEPRLLLVPTDTSPIHYRGDIGIPASEDCGPLTLRCRFGLWLKQRQLPGAQRSGFVGPVHIEQAWKCWQEIQGEGVLGQIPAEVLDVEYREWLAEVTLPARSQLLEAIADCETAQRADAAAPGRPRWRELPAAALILLSLGLAATVVWQQQEVSQLQLEAGKPVLNQPFLWLLPEDAERAGDRPLPELVDQAARYSLILQTAVPAIHHSYIVEIQDAEGRVSWRSPPLSATETGEVSLGLTRGWLEPGEYRLLLFGVQPSSDEVLHRYRLRIRPPPR